MVPAHQRLDAGKPQGHGVELRLIPGDELVLFDTLENFVGDALGGDDLGLQRLGEEFVAIAAVFLGPVERDIGVDQKLAFVDRHVAGRGDPDADAEPAGKAVIIDGLAHLHDNAVG